MITGTEVTPYRLGNRFQLYALIGGVPQLLSLKAVMGPGDEAEPVLTIMWPDED